MAIHPHDRNRLGLTQVSEQLQARWDVLRSSNGPTGPTPPDSLEPDRTQRQDPSPLDELTGAYLQTAGVAELARDIARAKRTEQPLVVAAVGVDRFKAVSELRGHTAADRLLVRVASTLRGKFRAYDLIVRYGGDAFLCAITGLGDGEVAQRLVQVNDSLVVSPAHASVTFGVAALVPTDSLDGVLGRADAALCASRNDDRPVTASPRRQLVAVGAGREAQPNF